jgi:hypothetical protein
VGFGGKDVKRTVQQIVDSSVHFTVWGVFALVPFVTTSLRQSDLSRDIIRHYSLWAHVYRILYQHILLLYVMCFVDAFERAWIERLLAALLQHLQFSSLPIAEHLLCAQWLTEFPYWSVLQCNRNTYLRPRVQHFFPSAFDSLQVKEAKLYALCACFSAECPPPPQILLCLKSLREYSVYRTDEYIVFVVMRTLQLFVERFSTTLFTPIFQQLCRVLRRTPTLHNNVVVMLNALRDVQLRHRLLKAFATTYAHSTPSTEFHYAFPLLYCIAADPHCAPTPLLRTLLRYVRTTSQIQKGEWSVGNALLLICRQLLITHPTTTLFHPLSHLLRFLSLYYADVDIRSRAQFYWALLTHLSDEKLKGILTQHTISLDDIPTGGREIAVELERSTDTHLTQPPHHFLRLVRVCSHYNMNTVEYLAERRRQRQLQQQLCASKDPYPKGESPSGDDRQHGSFSEEMTQLPHAYVEWLIQRRAIPTVIRLSYVLSYGTSTTPSYVQLPRLYGLQLNVVTTSLYATVPSLLQFPLLVPSKSSSTSPLSQAEFNNYPVIFALIPRCPFPSTFDVRVSYTLGESGHCIEGSLGTFPLSLSDLFLPVTLPPSYENLSRNLCLAFLFEYFWHSSEVEESFSDERKQQTLTSVKYLAKPMRHMTEILRTRFEPFLVDWNIVDETTKNSAGTTARVLIFLPPQYHLLLLFQLEEKQTIVHIRTDYWRILNFIDDFLDEL